MSDNFQIVQEPSGYTSLVGPAVELAAASETQSSSTTPPSRHPLHITLLTRQEMQQLSARGVSNPFSSSAQLTIVPLGLGRLEGSSWICVLVNKANLARRKAGLPFKDFHITLCTSQGVSPDSLPHGLDTLKRRFHWDISFTSIQLEALATHHSMRGEWAEARQSALSLIELDPCSFQAFTRLGDAALRLDQHKTAHLAFGQAFDTSLADAKQVKLREYVVKKLVETSQHCEWGTILTSTDRCEIEELSAGERQTLLRPWSDALRERVQQALETVETPPSLSLPSHVRTFAPIDDTRAVGRVLPRFFRWIVPFYLAASSQPTSIDDIHLLASKPVGIRHIVTLTEAALPNDWQRRSSLRFTHIPIEDHYAPSNELVQAFLRIASDDSSAPILVHCAGGKGRAGTMLACYLTAFGFKRPSTVDPWRYPAMSASHALAQLRQIRPGSVETRVQEERVGRFSSLLYEQGAPFPPPVEEGHEPNFSLIGALDKIDLLVLVGIAGSGKSWFRNALLARDRSWMTVSGDEDGGTSAVLAAASNHRGGKLIIDRCNLTAAHRKELLKLAQNAKSPVAIFFDVAFEVCLSRAQRRADHPTLIPGAGVKSIIKQMAGSLNPPELDEGFKGIVTVTTFASSLALVRRIAPPLTLLKYPRTPHLLNLGAATEDDLSGSLQSFARPGTTMVVTEKIDGANLAFSLDADRNILVQNRSHYIDSGTHAQFKKLGMWVEQHHEELDALLGQDASFPERFLLYGEWMAAVHSITYSCLPSLFLAFDLYDRATGKFVSRRTLDDKLEGGTITATPIVHQGSSLSERDLLLLMRGPSRFSDQQMEGLYLKLETDEEVIDRGKIVRADFIAGNERWNKGPLASNRVANELSR